MPQRPPTSPLFPYTTLFRSSRGFALTRCRRASGGQRTATAVSRAASRRAFRIRRRSRSEQPPHTPWSIRFSSAYRSEEHTSELQSRENLVCRLLLEKKKSAI